MAQFTTASLPGQANLAGSETALLLKMYSGEVMSTFDEKQIFMPLVRSKNVGAGRSHQFPAIGTASASYHVRGADILDPLNPYLNEIESGERTIQVDKVLLSSVFVDDWDEKLTHYEFRSEYAKQAGEAIANQMDKTIAQVIALAARSGATLTESQNGDPGELDKAGKVITTNDVRNTPSLMIDAMVEAATNFAEKDVPMEDVVFCVRPSMFFALQKQGDLLNVDFGNSGNGSQAGGSILKGYGFKIMWSNHLPSTVVPVTTGELNNYAGDFTKTQALAWNRGAVGTVIRQGMVTETEKSVRHQGDLLVSKFISGHGILRPECAVEIVDPLT
jgi:hypothetical protein